MRSQGRFSVCAFSALVGLLFTVPLAAGAPPASTHPAATQPAAGAGRKDRRSTAYDLYRQTLAFNQATLRGAYDRVGKRDAKWDGPARAFLDLMARYFSILSVNVQYLPADIPTHAQALALGKAALDAGCDDPLVMYCYGAVLQDSGKGAEAEPLIFKAFEGLQAGDYPANRVWAAASRAERTAAAPAAAGERREFLVIRARGVEEDYRVRAACGKLDDGARRYLHNLLQDELMAGPRAGQVAYIDQLKQRKDADPWLRDSLDGYIHIQLAWDKRGGGWANTVTEEGWKGFYEHLGIARDRLTAAWKLAPQLPEPATDMITVAMGGGGQLGESEMTWFERATDAQVDYLPAYDRIYNSLLPRWGGSYEQILELGRACIAYGRYDTLVPWQYAVAVKYIRNDSPAGAQILNDPKIYGELVKLTESYAAERKGRDEARWYKAYHAALAWKTGKLQEARKALDESADPLNAQPFEEFGARDADEAASGVYAMTGPHAAELKEAAARAESGDARTAVEKYRQVLAKLDKTDRATLFVANRAAATDERAKFDAGEWVNIQPNQQWKGWTRVEGGWRATDDELFALPDPSQRASAFAWRRGEVFHGPLEVAVHVEFLGHDPKRYASLAGVALFTPEHDQRGFVSIAESGWAGLWGFGDPKHPQLRTDVPASCDLLVRYTGDKAAVEINGKSVGAPFPLPDVLQHGVELGVGSSDGAPIRFTKLRVRKLDAPASKPAAEPAPGERPVPQKP